MNNIAHPNHIVDRIIETQGLDLGKLKEFAYSVDADVEWNIDRLRTETPLYLQGVYVGHSGGKDSVLVHWLAEQAFGPCLLVHTPKVNTHPKTIDFLYGLSIKHKMIYCPSKDHPGLFLKVQIDGTRIAEHDRTDGRSTDFVRDGENVSRTDMTLWVKNGLFGLSFIYPIYDWSNEQVWATILAKGIPFSGEYLL